MKIELMRIDKFIPMVAVFALTAPGFFSCAFDVNIDSYRSCSELEVICDYECGPETCLDNATCDDSAGYVVCTCEGGLMGNGIDACHEIPGPQPIAVGERYTLGVQSDGSVVVTGFHPFPISAELHEFTSFAAGLDDACGIKRDGSVACFGQNQWGQNSGLDSGTTFLQASAYGNHACGIKMDRTVVCWGDNEFNKATVPSDNKGFVSVQVSNTHSCGLKLNGSVYCWGKNDLGQATPITGYSFKELAVNDYSSCGLTHDGHIECWGDHPVFWDFGDGNHHLVGANETYCAIDSHDKITCWGTNAVAWEMPDLIYQNDFSTVAVGPHDACGLTLDSELLCWGESGYQDFMPSTENVFSQIAQGDDALCGLTQNGVVKCFELDRFETAPEGDDFVSITLGDHIACGLDDTGWVTCTEGWSVLGPNMTFEEKFSLPSSQNGDFTQVSMGSYHACGLQTDGSLRCWGSNYTHRGYAGQATVPAAGELYKMVTTGAYNTCAIMLDDTAFCFGDDFLDMSTPPDGVTFTDLSANSSHSCGVTTEGTIHCWGYPGHGETQASPDEFVFVRVATGVDHTCGLTGGGSIHCYGEVTVTGQFVPFTNTDFVGVTSADESACGLKSDGRLVCLGKVAFPEWDGILK